MKNSIKKLTVIIIAFAVSGIIYSCKKESALDSNSMTDDQLIEAIQKSTNKSAVLESDLPESSKSTIENDYDESFTNLAYLAPNLGYEVELRKCKGSYVGEVHYTYFDTEGRELNSGNDAKGKQGKHGKKRMGKDCFKLELPITLTMPDETLITIETEEDWANVKAWYDANAGTDERPQLSFPVNAVFDDGTVITVVSEEELKALHEECRDAMHESCFEMIYPITFIMPDESEIIVSDKGDRDAIKAWYEGNPEVDEKPTLKFPVELVMPEADTLTINNEEELKAIKDICRKEYSHEKKCFKLVLPVTVILPDSTTLTIETEEDWIKVKEWHEANPDVKEKGTLEFPVEVVYEDGTIVEVNSKDEMQALKKECAAEQKERQRGKNRQGNGGQCDNGQGNGGQGNGGQGSGSCNGNRGGN